MRNYLRSLLRSLDRVLASLLFSEPEFTVSALCHIASVSNPLSVKFYVLRFLARVLDHFFPGHTERAGSAAVDRANEVLHRLGRPYISSLK